MHLHRRSLVSTIAAMFATGLVAPLSRAMAAGLPRFELTHPVLNDAQRSILATVSERIVPTTDTPGAMAAGVPAFIEMMLADWYNDDERLLITGALDAIASAAKAYAAPFNKLRATRQDAILTLAQQDTLPGLPKGAFEHLRQLTLTGYYTSEIGCTVERVYLPVPGQYDGAYPYAKINRVFAW